MAELFKTNLVIVAAPLPPDWEGTPQEFFEAITERQEIQSPAGTNFFVTGDIEPSTNQGPWAKNGDRWWFFSPTLGRYVPENIDDSTANLFTVGPNQPGPPGESEANIWLRTSANRVIGWYFWDSVAWRAGGNAPPSGPTESRPQAPATDLEQYFDTDIGTLIHWERGAWRTVSGSVGDVKFVRVSLLEDALARNPGWEYVAEDNQAWRGVVLGVATKDAGDSPETSYTVASGRTARAAGDVVGEEAHILTSTEIEQHTHLIGNRKHVSGAGSNTINFFAVDDGAKANPRTEGAPDADDSFRAPAPFPPRHLESTSAVGIVKGVVMPEADEGTMLVTSKQLSLEKVPAPEYTKAAIGHNTMQPTVFCWALVKL